MILTFNDETLTGDILRKIEVDIDRERLTIKDLIETRVRLEVERIQKGEASENGLFQPSQVEKILNKAISKKTKSNPDPEKEAYIAWKAFKENQFFVFVDNRQAESLDEEVLVSPTTSVSFVKLTPLVGG